MEASSADPPAPLLALPGPEFPRVNFDKAHDAGSTQECPSRSGGVPFTISGRNLYLVHDREIDSEDHAERTAGSIWDCSLVLAKYLARHTDQLIRGKRVIELGSGQGVVGIACALAGAEQVTLTDVAAAVPKLEANLALNACEPPNAAAVLDWLRPDVSHLTPAQVIVAADVVWVEQLAAPFVAALQRVAEASARAFGQRAAIFLCHRSRSTRTDDELWRALRAAAFAVQEVRPEEHDETFRSDKLKIFRLQHA